MRTALLVLVALLGLDSFDGWILARPEGLSGKTLHRRGLALRRVRELEQRLATAEGWIGKAKPKVTAAKPQELADRNDLPMNNRAKAVTSSLRSRSGGTASGTTFKR